MKFDEGIMGMITRSGKTTNFGDHEWFMSPRFETSAEKFKWIESTMFVGRGRCIVEEQAAVEYEIYRVNN